MTVEIRDATAEDLETLLAMNEAAVPHVNSIPAEQMRAFLERAAYFRVAVVDGAIAGFLVGLTPDMDYASPNFRWFCRRYADFAYVDRIAIDPAARRLGLATALYDDFERLFTPRAPVMTCEVNLRPPNEGSMQFHLGRGFRRVGSQETEGGQKEVALLVKDLAP